MGRHRRTAGTDDGTGGATSGKGTSGVRTPPPRGRRSRPVGLSGSGLATVAVVALVALLPALTTPGPDAASPPGAVATDTSPVTDPADPAAGDPTDPAL